MQRQTSGKVSGFIFTLTTINLKEFGMIPKSVKSAAHEAAQKATGIVDAYWKKTMPQYGFEYVTPKKSIIMVDNNNFTMLGDDWGNNLIREAIIETGDKEALRLFDEEQEMMRKRAEVEVAEMRKRGELLD